MKTKTIDYLLIFFILTTFVCYFLIKQLVWDHIGIEANIEKMKAAANHEQWAEAKLTAEELKKDWEHYRGIIALNYGENDYTLFEEALEHVAAGSQAHDAEKVLTYTEISQDLWENMNQITPEP
ncbi:hypothetical protein MUN89_03390 [Halobacillus salinarum]|uniref:DUF4363 family protein n=1 Tax=Halobacillus salinarum TaxID=2932257 RepID=A0ABY4EKK9_9BACI|nr:hypothetical protein [Halobacillus salinarum]UOQ45010.1 hypothetical protein MUN89_03390 [Halobacillus salinarum]